MGLVGGWLTVADRRDRGGVPRSRDHPLRGLPVHRPHRPDEAARPRGRGDREAAAAAGGLAGDRLAGIGLARPVIPADPEVAPASPAPPVALYVHIPFCVSLCPYCDFVVYAGRGRARPGRAGRRLPRGRFAPSSTCAPTRSTSGSGADRPPLETRLPGRRDAVAPAGRRRRGAPGARASAVRDRRRRRGHARGQSRARTSAAIRRALARRRRHPAVARRAGAVRSPSCGGSGAATGRADVAAAVARGARGRDRLDQPGPAVRRPGADRGELDGARSMRRSSWSPTTCRSTR